MVVTVEVSVEVSAWWAMQRGSYPCASCTQTEEWQVEQKADNSPLTRADREANAVICEGLAQLGAAGAWLPGCGCCRLRV